jgi:tRNA (guanine37-N1)-methyltransferase
MVSKEGKEPIMRIDVITLFPSMFYGPFGESILKRACDRDLIELNVVDLREYTHDKYRTVDDRPFGGGAGMVMKCEPLFEAVEDLRTEESKVIIMTPQGKKFSQQRAVSLSQESHLIFICGHYEGIDERVHEKLADLELSIGDYILTNGNLSAMVITDAICRLVPGVLDGEETLSDESFNQEGLLEYPHYTRPRVFRGMEVPEVLLSGNHKAIASWRRAQSEIRTEQRRPDLLSGAEK